MVTKTAEKPQITPVKRAGLLGEYMYFLKTYKAWWLLPVFALVFVLGLLVVMGGSQAAMLIYALF